MCRTKDNEANKATREHQAEWRGRGRKKEEQKEESEKRMQKHGRMEAVQQMLGGLDLAAK